MDYLNPGIMIKLSRYIMIEVLLLLYPIALRMFTSIKIQYNLIFNNKYHK
jgi:hypothetical protein